MKAYMLIVMAMIISASANAGGWTSFVTPTHIVFAANVTDGSRVYVYIDGDLNPDGCTGGGAVLSIDGSTQEGKYMVSTILTAISTGRQIMPDLNGCESANNRPIIIGLDM